MATLTIPFPEGTRTIALRGNRITVGRLPDNTIQIRDRTVSAYHAELLLEGNHYRVHDLGATNGVLVNGKQVADFHLQEDCKVNLGGVACTFSSTGVISPDTDEVNPLPTRAEMQNILQANGDLRSEVAALREQVNAMNAARESDSQGEKTVSMEEFDKVVAELAAARASLHERQTQLDRLTAMIAIANRERETLQRSYDELRQGSSDGRLKAALAAPNTTAASVSGPSATPPSAAKSPMATSATKPVAEPAKMPPTQVPSVKTPAVAPSAPTAPSAPNGIPSPGNPPVAPATPRPSPQGQPVKAGLPKPPNTIAGGTLPRRTAPTAPTAAPKAPATRFGANLVPAGAGATGPKGTQKLEE